VSHHDGDTKPLIFHPAAADSSHSIDPCPAYADRTLAGTTIHVRTWEEEVRATKYKPEHKTEKSFDIAALIFEFVRHIAHRLDNIAGIDESELDLNSGQEQSQLSLF
jgi:hypothetical protein